MIVQRHNPAYRFAYCMAAMDRSVYASEYGSFFQGRQQEMDRLKKHFLTNGP